MDDLLSAATDNMPYRPLADRMRPTTLAEFFGQQHMLAEGGALRQAIEAGSLHSMVFWGPPGTGKTTLAKIIAHSTNAAFLSISAVLSGVKDIRSAIDQAKQYRAEGRSTILFVDEVHRFNKSQQDAFLPYIEDGTIYFVGATTENPSFELNNALLSRVKTYVLKSLPVAEIKLLLQRALQHENGLAKENIVIEDAELEALANIVDGDARRALNFLEIAADLAEPVDGKRLITRSVVEDVSAHSLRRFDKGGDLFYEQISALHKSVRGSNPDASLYWFARMIDGGCDPLYIARRVVRMASEDIGNADPRGLQIALDAWNTYERLGSPEGELAIAQAIVYLASTAKSNAVYIAWHEAMADARRSGSMEVPLHIRNAPTGLMKDMGYGKDYRYAHDEEGAFAAGETYFPDEMGERVYYQPVERGLELKIREKLDRLRELNQKSRKQR
ncbi:MAG: replication-associated recombination protein A [Gammaproteobacteria bacterium]|nr:replication-associated recombination protein A [Gammaproteobacteria bacterium]